MLIRKVLMLAAGGMLVLPLAGLAELPKAEQICINKMNKDAVKVMAAQLKVNDGCVKDEVKKGVPGDADVCIEADVKGKVGKKRAKTASDETKKCGSPPAVLFTGAANTNDTAEEAAKALVRDVFGPTLSSLASCDTNANECLCQRKVINRVSKLERALAKIWLKCKKSALKDGKEPFAIGGGTTAAELRLCVTDGALAGGLSVQTDTKGKVADATSQLQATATQFCGAASIDEFATGECSGFSAPPAPLDGAGLASCLADQAKCRFCEHVNGVDALGIDCDTWVGTTCP